MKINKHHFKKLSVLSLLLPLFLSTGCEIMKSVFHGPVEPKEYQGKSIFEYVKAQAVRVGYDHEANIKAERDDGHVKKLFTENMYQLGPIAMRGYFSEFCTLNKGFPLYGFCYDNETYKPLWAVLFTEKGWYGIDYEGAEVEGSKPEILFGGEEYEMHVYSYSKSKDDPEWLSFIKAKQAASPDEVKKFFAKDTDSEQQKRKELIKQCADTIGKERSEELAQKCEDLTNPHSVNKEIKITHPEQSNNHQKLRNNVKSLNSIVDSLNKLPF